jgi:hypothetical protein
MLHGRICATKPNGTSIERIFLPAHKIGWRAKSLGTHRLWCKPAFALSYHIGDLLILPRFPEKQIGQFVVEARKSVRS